MLRAKIKNKINLIIIIICLSLIILYYLGLSRFSVGLITRLTNPVIRTAYYLTNSFGNFVSLYLSRQNFVQVNDQLRKDLISSAEANVELHQLREENEWLKQELKFVSNYNYDFVIARVLGTGPGDTQSHIIIDQGYLAGLKPGLAVTTDQGVIIGQISQVEANLSHVDFLISNSSKLASEVKGVKSYLGLAHGQHNLNLKIDMLPKDADIKLGDIAVTSNLNKNIPAGLMIGYISQVFSAEENLWQEAMINPAIDYQSVKMVTVILPLPSF